MDTHAQMGQPMAPQVIDNDPIVTLANPTALRHAISLNVNCVTNWATKPRLVLRFILIVPLLLAPLPPPKKKKIGSLTQLPPTISWVI